MSTEICGTYGGFQRHGRLGQEACEACRAARNEYMRTYRNGKGATSQKRVMSVTNRALRELARRHNSEYRELYVEYMGANS